MKKLLLIFLAAAFAIAVQSATLNIRRVKNAATPPTPTNFLVLLISSQPTNAFLTWSNQAATYSNIVVQRSTNTSTVWLTVTNLHGTNVAYTDAFTWTNSPTYYRIYATGSNGLLSDVNNQP